MILFDNEKTIINSDNGEVTLTNQRIVKENKGLFKSNFISIFLEDISSIEKGFKSKPIYLFLALVSFIIGYFMGAENENVDFFSFGVVIAVLFVILFFFSRKHVIIIESKGGKTIEILIKGMSETNVDVFIKDVQETKKERLNNLYK